MSNHPIDTFELREDLAAVRKLHADAAEAVALRAEVQRLREALDQIHDKAIDGAMWYDILAMAHDALEVPRG